MFATRKEAFDHLKMIVTEIDAERRGERSRPTDEVRRRRSEIAIMLMFAELISRTKPELANQAEVLAKEAAREEERKELAAKGREDLVRDFVAELEAMAKPDRLPDSNYNPRT